MKFVTDLGINGCKSARTVIQKETGRSRGFGYLDFVTHTDAVNALAALQGKELDGRALKLDLDEGNDGPRKGRRMPLTSPDFSIYIGNLPFSLRNEELRDTLVNIFGNDFGAINVRIAFADYTRSRGFAHVDFANQESANIALEKLAGFEIQGRPAIIRPAAGKLPRQDNAPRTPRNFEEKRDMKPFSGTTDFSVFIGNLPWEADKDLIREMIDDVVGKEIGRAHV
jgi:nucleolin